MIRIIIVTIILIFLIGCGKQEPIETTNKDSDIAIYLNGGLGSNQLVALTAKLEVDFPNAQIITFGNWNSYKADLSGYIKEHPHKINICIGHSYGCDLIVNSTEDAGIIDLAILIDPVATSGDKLTLQPNIMKTVILRRSELLGPWTANIIGSNTTTYTIKGSHNELPNLSDAWLFVEDAIKKEIE